MVSVDFFTVPTIRFQILYVFLVLAHDRRRILHFGVTAHPTAEWTLQQFRETLSSGHPYRFVIHDRDSIFSKALDQGVTDLGVRVLRTPVRAPMANSVCERFGGTLRGECVDFLIPFNQRHSQMTMKERGIHYIRGRPLLHARAQNVERMLQAAEGNALFRKVERFTFLFHGLEQLITAVRKTGYI